MAPPDCRNRWEGLRATSRVTAAGYETESRLQHIGFGQRWRAGRRYCPGMQRRGRPPSFTRDALIAAAIRLGPDAISVPGLAAELGVARTSIYWHARDVNEVGEAVLAAIVDENGGIGWKPNVHGSWDQVMASYARWVRRGLLAAGGWIRFATAHMMFGRDQLQAMDGLVQRLCACGFSTGEAARAYAYLFRVVLASIGSGGVPVSQMHGALLTELNSGDGDGDFVVLRKVAAAAARLSPDAQFEYDLDCTLRGIAAHSGIPLGTRPDGKDHPQGAGRPAR